MANNMPFSMIIRIMTPYFHLGQDVDFPLVDPSSGDLNTFSPTNTWFRYFNLNGTRSRDVRGNHSESIRELGALATVMLKNVNNALPLKAPKSIAVFGNDAGDDSQGFLNQVNFEQGTLVAGGGSGTGRLTSLVTPLDAIKVQAAKDGAIIQPILNNTLLANTNISTLVNPTEPDVCLVFLKTWAEEAADRQSLNTDWHGNEVVESVASYCSNTVVITHSSGINNLPFADHPNVTAILAAHFPGEQSGNSIVDVLYGKVNPSGKLPYTIALEIDDYNALPVTSVNSTDPYAWQVYFEEKLEIDYRYFDAQNMPVRYEFGFGLSYTTFSVADLTFLKCGNGTVTSVAPAGAVTPGGNAALWETLWYVTVELTNTGSVAGAEVPQLYITLPDSAPAGTPPKQLRGFEKVQLEPGASTTVTFPLMRRDLSYWDIISQDWIIPTGEIGFSVGLSSRDLKLTAGLTVVE
jgi:beta-glucosidase